MTTQHPAAPETKYPTGAIVPERQRCICDGVCLDNCRACNYSGRDLEEPCIADPDWEPDDDDLARREGLPAAPETDVSALAEGEVQAVRIAAWTPGGNISAVVGLIVAERLRVVEGERDALRAEVDVLRRGHQKVVRFGALDRVRAESAEADRDALRAGIWRLGESIHGDEGVEHVDGCEGEPTCFACILADLRALLPGDGR